MNMKRFLPIAISALLAVFIITAVICVSMIGRGGGDDSGVGITGSTGSSSGDSNESGSNEPGPSEPLTTEPPAVTGLSVSISDGDGVERVLFDAENVSEAEASFTADADTDGLIIRRAPDDRSKVSLILEGDGSADAYDLSFTEGICRFPLDGIGGGSYSLSLSVREGNGITYYASTPGVFADAVSGGGDAGLDITVVQIADIATGGGETVITEPFSWYTNGFAFASAEALRFVSDKEGTLSIMNDGADSIVTGGFFCETPLWDITVAVPFAGLCETRPFYVFAKSVNGVPIDIGELYIDSEDDAGMISGRLGEPEFYPFVERVVCDGNFTLPALTVRRPISFVISGSVDIDGTLAFEFGGEGSVSVDTSANAHTLTQKITFETPSADVTWNGGDAPTFEYVEQYMNVRTYNGTETDSRLGGEGTSRLTGGTLRDTVTGFEAELTPDGSFIDLSLSYPDDFDINRASVSAELTSGGTAELKKDGDEWFLNVKDGEGKTRGYRLTVYDKSYRLPIIYITTADGTDIDSQEEYKDASITVKYNGAYDFTDLTSLPCGIRGRGNSSWELDKKPYKIKLETSASLFGLRKAKRWTLIANHCDHSLIRNKVAYAVGGVLDNLVFVPSAYMVDVFVNGKYRGVYQLSEQIEINKGRVPGEEDSTEADTDYLLEIGGKRVETDFGTTMFKHKYFRYVEVVDPDSDILTKEQFDFVSGYVKSVEDAIADGGDYESLLDVPSLIDWFLLYEYSYNIDGIFRRSDFLLKKKGGKLFFCTPWDFDYAFANMGPNSDKCDRWLCFSYMEGELYEEYLDETFLPILFEDPKFVNALKARWAEVGEKMLKTALETVDEAEELVSRSAEDNFAVWKMIDKRVQYERRESAALKTYDAHLDYLRDFLKNRFDWMDKTIKGL